MTEHEVLDFYGLKTQPFAPTADPTFFFPSRSAAVCLEDIANVIDGRQGLVLVLGSPGVGKTLLMRRIVAALNEQPDQNNVAVLSSPPPTWTSMDFLAAILDAFDISPPAEPTFAPCLQQLQRFLYEQRRASCVLFIDEAQNLQRRGQLELLRLLQNLENASQKLLTVVCFAQESWLEVLRSVPAFSQRAAVVCTLEPFTAEDTANCIHYRLSHAGNVLGVGPEFTDEAVQAIHTYGEGVPREVLTLCRHVLRFGAQEGLRTLRADIVLRVVDRTTLRDPIRRARVVSVLTRGGTTLSAEGSVSTSASPMKASEDVTQDAEQIARDLRAAEILLRRQRTK